MKTSLFMLEVPPNAEIKKCRGCDARIVWGTTKKGNSVPLSIDHKEARWIEENGTRVCVVAPSHFQDCPKADDFTSRKKR